MTTLRAFPPSVNAEGNGGRPSQLAARPISKAPKAAPLTFLLPGRIAFGVLTGLQGDPNIGKSLIVAALAAAVTGGPKLPGVGRRRKWGKALILTREDDIGRDVLPRVQAAGGDPELVIDLTDAGKALRSGWTPHEDLAGFEALIRGEGVRLVALDPITSWLPPGVNVNDEKQVRPLLEDLAGVAMRTGAAFVALRHLRKVRSANVVDPGLGSVAFYAVPRAVLICDKVDGKPDLYGMGRPKGNFGPRPPALLYRIADAGGVGVVRFAGEDDLAGEQLGGVASDAAERDARDDARKLLREMLAGGPVSSALIKKKAADAVISEVTLRRAKAELGVRSRRVGFGEGGVWEWLLAGREAKK